MKKYLYTTVIIIMVLTMFSGCTKNDVAVLETPSATQSSLQTPQSSNYKTFEMVYEDGDLLHTIDYFNAVNESLTVDEQKDFSIKIGAEIEKLSEVYDAITTIEMDQSTPAPAVIQYVNWFYPNIYKSEDSTFNIAGLNDNQLVERVTSLQDDELFELTKVYWATDGCISDMGFGVVLHPEIVEKLTKCIEIAYQDTSIPDMIPTDVLKVGDTSYESMAKYPVVYIPNTNMVNLFDEAWKETIHIAVTIINEEIKDDLSMGYDYFIDDEGLKFQYTNTGNTVTLVSHNSKPSETVSIGTIMNANMAYNGDRIYFETPEWATSNAIYYVDLNTKEVAFFTDGWFITYIGEEPYCDDVVVKKTYLSDTTGRMATHYLCNANGEELCNLGVELEEDVICQINGCMENLNNTKYLEGFTNEVINGLDINYDDYMAVVIPMYQGVNKELLTPHRWDIGAKTTTDVTFAVFGKLEQLIITQQIGIDVVGVVQEVGTIENVMMTIKTDFPGDMSHIKITGIIVDKNGNENIVDFTLSDDVDCSTYQAITISK